MNAYFMEIIQKVQWMIWGTSPMSGNLYLRKVLGNVCVCVFFPIERTGTSLPWLVVSALRPSKNMYIIGMTIRKMAEHENTCATTDWGNSTVQKQWTFLCYEWRLDLGGFKSMGTSWSLPIGCSIMNRLWCQNEPKRLQLTQIIPLVGSFSGSSTECNYTERTSALLMLSRELG